MIADEEQKRRACRQFESAYEPNSIGLADFLQKIRVDAVGETTRSLSSVTPMPSRVGFSFGDSMNTRGGALRYLDQRPADEPFQEGASANAAIRIPARNH